MEYDVELTVNDVSYRARVPANVTLLRAVARLSAPDPGTKEGCGIGECGACSVEVDGKLVNACLMLGIEANGSRVRTIEGEARGDELSDLQRAFIDQHALQCGFCTPGMIMAASDLLARNPDPTDDEIVEAMAGKHLPLHRVCDSDCRCEVGGAGPQGRCAMTVPFHSDKHQYVGGSAQRVDAVDKVTGSAVYVHDMAVPGMLHARMKTSPHAHARIVRVDTTAAAAVPGVRAIVSGNDLDIRLGLYMVDRYILARGIVRYQGEPVAAVAAETEEAADQACALIEVEYEPLPRHLRPGVGGSRGGRCWCIPTCHTYQFMKGVFFPEAHTNIAHHQKIRKGELEKGFAQAARVFEHRFTNPPGRSCPPGDSRHNRPGAPGVARACDYFGPVALHRAQSDGRRIRPPPQQHPRADSLCGRRIRGQGRDSPRTPRLLPVPQGPAADR